MIGNTVFPQPLGIELLKLAKKLRKPPTEERFASLTKQQREAEQRVEEAYKLLRDGDSAEMLAKRMGCTTMSAYNRLKKLVARKMVRMEVTIFKSKPKHKYFKL